MKSMEDLFLHFLQDIYYAEKQGVKALAKVGKNAENEEFKKFLDDHREESQEQIGKLEEVYQQVIGKKARGKTCEAMNGLIAEVNEAISEGEKGPVLDAALIACVQAMKHYEIARLGALAAWAKQMGHDEAAETLHELVDQDKDADEDLNEIAEGHANPEASGTDDEEEDEDEDDEEDDDEAAEDEEDDEEDEDDEAADEAEESESVVAEEPPAPAPARAPARRKRG
jgi:ferritin-like metal-binding protein YciE